LLGEIWLITPIIYGRLLLINNDKNYYTAYESTLHSERTKSINLFLLHTFQIPAHKTETSEVFQDDCHLGGGGILKYYFDELWLERVKDLSIYKISWPHIDWFKVCIHIRSSNVRHFGMSETMRLKKYGFKVTFSDMASLMNLMKTDQLLQMLLMGGWGGTQTWTQRQNSDLTSLTFLFKISGLKTDFQNW
jgi:hypothetical protein